MDDIIFNNLLNNQKKNIFNNRLEYSDLKRISNNLSTCIFDKNECSIWKGSSITINDNTYVNFYFNGKKKSLQRLLYENYVGKISNQYINYTCENKGLCCNINHFSVKPKKIKKNNINNKKLEDQTDNDTNNSKNLFLNI